MISFCSCASSRAGWRAQSCWRVRRRNSVLQATGRPLATAFVRASAAEGPEPSTWILEISKAFSAQAGPESKHEMASASKSAGMRKKRYIWGPVLDEQDYTGHQPHRKALLRDK